MASIDRSTNAADTSSLDMDLAKQQQQQQHINKPVAARHWWSTERISASSPPTGATYEASGKEGVNGPLKSSPRKRGKQRKQQQQQQQLASANNGKAAETSDEPTPSDGPEETAPRSSSESTVLAVTGISLGTQATSTTASSATTVIYPASSSGHASGTVETLDEVSLELDFVDVMPPTNDALDIAAPVARPHQDDDDNATVTRPSRWRPFRELRQAILNSRHATADQRAQSPPPPSSATETSPISAGAVANTASDAASLDTVEIAHDPPAEEAARAGRPTAERLSARFKPTSASSLEPSARVKVNMRNLMELSPSMGNMCGIISHYYRHGPPCASWTLSAHLTVAVMRDVLARLPSTLHDPGAINRLRYMWERASRRQMPRRSKRIPDTAPVAAYHPDFQHDPYRHLEQLGFGMPPTTNGANYNGLRIRTDHLNHPLPADAEQQQPKSPRRGMAGFFSRTRTMTNQSARSGTQYSMASSTTAYTPHTPRTYAAGGGELKSGTKVFTVASGKGQVHIRSALVPDEHRHRATRICQLQLGLEPDAEDVLAALAGSDSPPLTATTLDSDGHSVPSSEQEGSTPRTPLTAEWVTWHPARNKPAPLSLTATALGASELLPSPALTAPLMQHHHHLPSRPEVRTRRRTLSHLDENMMRSATGRSASLRNHRQSAVISGSVGGEEEFTDGSYRSTSPVSTGQPGSGAGYYAQRQIHGPRGRGMSGVGAALPRPSSPLAYSVSAGSEDQHSVDFTRPMTPERAVGESVSTIPCQSASATYCSGSTRTASPAPIQPQPPTRTTPTSPPVILYLHGGALMSGSAVTYRPFTARMARDMDAAVFVVNYRLSPEYMFPAALQDVLAAYLYLIDPTLNSGFGVHGLHHTTGHAGCQGISPRRVILAGDSGGGNLVMALLLALRDAQLPLPAGAVGVSPWVDLTYSMPSISGNGDTDYLPHPGVLDEVNTKLGLWPDRDHFYVRRREQLKSPYVSPMWAEDLSGLPPVLVQVGGAERLRDEGIRLASRAAAVSTGELATQSVASSASVRSGSSGHFRIGQSARELRVPTTVRLEQYDEMPHVWSCLPAMPLARLAQTRAANFMRACLTTPDDIVSEFMRIAPDGELLEHDRLPESVAW